MKQKTLVVIDVQNYYVNEETKSLTEKIARYISGNNFAYGLFPKFVNTKNSNLWKHLGWKKMHDPHDTDIYPSLQKFLKPGHVFEKNTYSIFKSRPFVYFLKSKAIIELSLCGFDTDACILASHYDGFDLGYRIRVINELCGSHAGKPFHEFGLAIINKNLQRLLKR